MTQYHVQIVLTRRTGTDPYQFEEISRTDPLYTGGFLRSGISGPETVALRGAQEYIQRLQRLAGLDRERVARLIHDATTQRPAKVPFDCDYEAADAVLGERNQGS